MFVRPIRPKVDTWEAVEKVWPHGLLGFQFQKTDDDARDCPASAALLLHTNVADPDPNDQVDGEGWGVDVADPDDAPREACGKCRHEEEDGPQEAAHAEDDCSA